MEYPHTFTGTFIRRPNRFIALVDLGGQTETVHVPNTGRCAELFLPGSMVSLSRASNPQRKTAFSLIAVRKGERWINIDSQVPNAVVAEALRQGSLPGYGLPQQVRREVTYGRSRFDIHYQNETGQGFIEVKGVTLEKDNLALFPDAPTLRGTRHLMELAAAAAAGYQAGLVFLVQMGGVQSFSPNTAMDPAFSQALHQAGLAGVKISCFDCQVTESSICLGSSIPVIL